MRPKLHTLVAIQAVLLLVALVGLGLRASPNNSHIGVDQQQAVDSSSSSSSSSSLPYNLQQQEQHDSNSMQQESLSSSSQSHQQQQPSQEDTSQPQRRRLQETTRSSKGRILYIVTTLNEYNSGTRSTQKGSDRLQLTLIPVVSLGIRSMLAAGYEVDLFLVCHFTLAPERLALIRQALPDSVGIDVWNDATPLGYDTGKKPFTKLEYRTLHLARQHRFVIKEKLLDYDLFVNFEDDMLIKAEHIDHFVAVTNELDRLYELAPRDPPPGIRNREDALLNYHGVLTKGQLRRMIPGFIRVETLLDEDKYPAQSQTGPVPVDLVFEKSDKPGHVNASVCCHVDASTSNPHIPSSPSDDQLMLWETHSFALGVRQMPADSWLDWVVLQRGPAQGKLNVSDTIGDYWSNRNGDYWPNNKKRPKPLEFKYINNQGGWMATRDQLWRWHTEICPGGFLPPYEAPHYNFDGLDMRNVEWYSGGMQLFTVRHACNMQRVIALDPAHFSRSLIYHTANNKQRQLHSKREDAFVKANTLLGQLNALKKRAANEMEG